MGKVKCRRRMRCISNNSDILVCVETNSKMPRVKPIEMQKKKTGVIGVHEKSRAFKKGELKSILEICGSTNLITKRAAFKVDTQKSKENAAIVKAKAVKFKAGLDERKWRDSQKRTTARRPSKHTPKGTIHVAEPTKRILAKMERLKKAA